MFWSTLALAAPEAVEVRTAVGPVVIDGRLDEPAWLEAPIHGRFERFQPTDGGPPQGRTEVRVLQDDRNLYFAIRVEEAGYPIRAHISPREDINRDDQIGIYLDTFSDGISGYIFYFNALGIQQDIRHNAGDWNVAWDTLLRSRGEVTEQGYTLEIALPWRSLKFPSTTDPQTWGLLVTRKIPGEGAKYGWPKQERNAPRLFQAANHLTGVRPPSRGSGWELIPALTAATALPRETVPALETVRPSLDVRLGITPDIGLAATLNPDFSQVESDVSDIRLNARFAYAFPERRPFFLDGIDWFRDVGDTLYTRSMNEPLYGVKIGGREGEVTLGALQVLDRAPLPSFNEATTPGFSEEDVADALASTSLLRTRLDAFAGGFAGLTLADKRFIGGRSSHQLAGVDLNVPLGDRWIAETLFQHSFTSDGDDRLWGTRQKAAVERASGVGTGGGLYFASNSPGYRNEVGFTTQSDRTDGGGWIDHTFTPSGRVDTIRPNAWTDLVEEGNGDRYRTVGSGLDVRVGGVHLFSASGWLQGFRERGVAIDGHGGGARYTGNFGSAVDVSLSTSGGRTIDYAALVPATVSLSSATLYLRPTAGLQTETTLQVNTFSPSTGTGTQSMLLRSRVNGQFSRALGARWVLDWSRFSDREPRLYNAVLLTWLTNPGTAFWLGGSVVGTEDGPVGSLFAKATVLLRP